MRWSWAVRRAAAGADPPRRLGLPDRRFGQRSQTPAPARAASGRGLPCSRRHLAARGGQAMTATVLGIADDRALGSSLRLIVTRPQSLAAAKAVVDDVIRAVDVAASRFRDDSELTMLNARPDQVTIVSPLLASAIAAALRGAELTGGAVDPTIGAAMRLVGYDGDFASIEADGPPLHLVARGIPGWKAIRFSSATRSILIPRGVELDLGASAKALAADLAAAAAHKAVGGGVLVSLGGDIAVAGDAPPGGWLGQASEDSAAPISDAEETISIANGGVGPPRPAARGWGGRRTVVHSNA